MSIFKKLFELKCHRAVSKSVVSSLFYLERNTLIALILVETIFLYILMPLIGNIIAAWYGIVVILTLWRLYDAYDFQNNPNRHTNIKWHKKFVIKVWLTALMLSLLALFSTPLLNDYYQLFIAIMLIGISAWAVKTLSDDYRTAIGYLMILLLPVIVEMLLFMRSETYFLAFMMTLYFFMQAGIILHAYEQNAELEEQEKDLSKVRKELFKQQEILHLFLEQVPMGIYSYDKNLIITGYNKALLELLNLQKEELIGIELKNIFDHKIIESARSSLVQGSKSYVGVYRSAKGLNLWIEGKYSPVHNEKGVITGGVGLVEDKTKEHNAINDLRYLVSHDPMTSLSNRRGFIDFMREMIQKEEHNDYFSILFYLDLDKFKNINDSLGHTFGDKVLIETAERLISITDNTHNLTRLGGDEFTIVVPFVSKSRDKAKERAEIYLTKLQKYFDKPFIVDGVHLHVRASVGIVIIEPKFSNVEEIVRYADISMYKAKKDIHGHVSYYDTKLDIERKKAFDLQQDIINGLHEDQFELFFQPIINIKDDSLYAAEALIRWKHSKNGMILPVDFIPLAIESGMIEDIGWWTLDRVCQHISQWKKDGSWNLEYVSINIDARQLLKNDFATTFMSKLSEHGVDNKDITMEITETSLIDNFTLTIDVLKELHSSGIRCAIDDFGVGYSSLSYLKKLSFNILKIDKEFIKDLTYNKKNIILIKSIIEIGKQFNYSIVIEGIEDEKQKKIIKDIDNSLSYQGHLVSPAISELEFRSKYLS